MANETNNPKKRRIGIAVVRWSVHRRHPLLGRVQHRHGGRPTPRSSASRCHEMKNNVYVEYRTTHPLQQPDRRPRHLPGTATCPSSGCTRWCARSRPRTSSTTRPWAASTPRPVRGQAGGARPARVDSMKKTDSRECRQLPRFGSMDYTNEGHRGNGGPPAGLRRRQDLHRLPQGHRPPAARHARHRSPASWSGRARPSADLQEPREQCGAPPAAAFCCRHRPASIGQALRVRATATRYESVSSAPPKARMRIRFVRPRLSATVPRTM